MNDLDGTLTPSFFSAKEQTMKNWSMLFSPIFSLSDRLDQGFLIYTSGLH